MHGLSTLAAMNARPSLAGKAARTPTLTVTWTTIDKHDAIVTFDDGVSQSDAVLSLRPSYPGIPGMSDCRDVKMPIGWESRDVRVRYVLPTTARPTLDEVTVSSDGYVLID